MEKPEIIFKEYCKRNRMRYTPERDLIIREIYRENGHFGIDDLFLRIRNRHPKTKLAKGSIYRIIPYLINAGLIRISFTDRDHVCYEYTLGHSHHDHMKCIRCGRIFEFYDERIDRAQQEICRKRGFKMLWHVHVIGGYCSRCQMQYNSKQKKKEGRECLNESL